MIATFALIGTLLSALWLVFVAGLMAVAPHRALAALRAAGSTWTLQIGEHVLRGLAGLCLIGVADGSRAPTVFLVAGSFILATSVLILLLPRRWHHAYAVAWAERISPLAMRCLAPFSLAGGLALLWAMRAG
ncbi:hypothetical protein [Maricaulis parjimensis]|uniref:hypothetical protein n=1 Tax=Maricaulis parjimensis TaxID=144023 RepID=UPI00193AA361|nr:hypothetical protein [Maricaulis parjimensis]